MRIQRNMPANRGENRVSLLAAGLIMFAFFLLIGLPDASLGQNKAKTKAIDASFYPEAGCPVEVTSIRCLLEIDPFGAPIASRVYITYKNNSPKPLSAVKFRIRYADSEGKDKGTFHAPDGSVTGIAPGATRSNKWRKEGGLHPDIQSFKVRVFKVRYTDGSQWESMRARQIREQKNQNSSS